MKRFGNKISEGKSMLKRFIIIVLILFVSCAFISKDVFAFVCIKRDDGFFIQSIKCKRDYDFNVLVSFYGKTNVFHLPFFFMRIKTETPYHLFNMFYDLPDKYEYGEIYNVSYEINGEKYNLYNKTSPLRCKIKRDETYNRSFEHEFREEITIDYKNLKTLSFRIVFALYDKNGAKEEYDMTIEMKKHEFKRVTPYILEFMTV